jgi:hypothetical protein
MHASAQKLSGMSMPQVAETDARDILKAAD